MKLKSTTMEEDDERREEAIASVAPLQSTFKPLGVSQDQLSKFQELHKRRLLIKSKAKNDKKKGKCREKKLDTNNDAAANFCKCAVDEKCSRLSSKNRKVEGGASLQSDDESVHHSSKKQRQKLHWGYYSLSSDGDYMRLTDPGITAI